MGTVLRGRSRGRFLRLQPVGGSDDQEYGEGDDDEGDHVVDELSVIDRHRSGCLRLGQGSVRRRALGARLKHVQQIGEIHVAQGQADWWHDDIIDQGFHNGPKGPTDDDAHGEVEHIAP
jgi:hypothetical protein